MARYIDADKFIKDLQSEYHGMISDESLKIYKIIHRLDNEPTADVVEVCRCKDCHNSERIDTVLYCNYFNKNVDEDDFCSQGG